MIFRDTHPVDQVSAGNMELRSRPGISGSPGHVRESESRNESHKQADIVNSMASVNSPFSAIGIARGGKAPSRVLPVEGDQLGAVGPQPRSESTGGATTSPGGDPPRRQWQIRGSGDVGGRATPSYQPETVAAESGKYLHHPDEGRPEFTQVPYARTDVCKHSFIPATVRMWNSLPVGSNCYPVSLNSVFQSRHQCSSPALTHVTIDVHLSA